LRRLIRVLILASLSGTGLIEPTFTTFAAFTAVIVVRNRRAMFFDILYPLIQYFLNLVL